MADPEVSSNNTEYQKLVRALTDIQEAVDAFGEYKDLERQLVDAKELLRESEGEARARWLDCLRRHGLLEPAVAWSDRQRRTTAAPCPAAPSPVPAHLRACHAG